MACFWAGCKETSETPKPCQRTLCDGTTGISTADGGLVSAWWQGAEVNPVCTAADLEGFPTWIIGDKKLSGEQTFDQLETALSKINS